MGCTDGMIGIGAGVVFEGVTVELYRKADTDEADIKFTADCLNGSVIRHANKGKTKDLPCYTDPLTGWTFKYVEYVTDLFIKVEICKKTFPAPEPEPEPDPEDLTNYDKIKIGTQTIIDAMENRLTICISDTANLIGYLQDDIQDWIDGVSSQIIDQTTALTGLIGDLSKGLTDRIDSLSDYIDETIGSAVEGLGSKIDAITNALTDGLSGMEGKIESLQIPTLESIKEGFLDTCGILALALWDAILDRIEDRYPEDKEEED